MAELREASNSIFLVYRVGTAFRGRNGVMSRRNGVSAVIFVHSYKKGI